MAWPVRYSSVTRPLNSESFVQGLFALIELARLRAEGVASCTMSLAETASYVRTRVSTVMNGPLVTAWGQTRARAACTVGANRIRHGGIGIPGADSGG